MFERHNYSTKEIMQNQIKNQPTGELEHIQHADRAFFWFSFNMQLLIDT